MHMIGAIYCFSSMKSKLIILNLEVSYAYKINNRELYLLSFGRIPEWLCQEVIKAVPQRHFIFSIPKILRRYFLFDRKLLSELSRCAWESLKEFFQEATPEEDAVPGAAVAIQSFGDFLGFNPHCHILSTDGCFYRNGMFRVAPRFEAKQLEEIFRHNVFKMLLSKGKITQELVDMLMSWRHSGFNVYCGPRIQPGDDQAMENLARGICPPIFVADHPGIIFPGENDLHSRGVQSHLPI